MSNTTLAERLKIALERSGKSQRALALYCGVSTASTSYWFNGKTKVLTAENAMKAAMFLEVSVEWLTSGKGKMSNSSNIKVFAEGDTPPDNVVVIHEYRLVFGAHSDGIEPTPEWEIVEGGDDYWYRLSFFQQRNLNPDHCKRTKVTGNSMEPFIYGGDTVLFSEVADPRPACVTICDGKIYVLSVDGKLKIKRLASIKNGISVRSDNPDYKPEDYTGDELSRLRIYGRVIEVSRSL